MTTPLIRWSAATSIGLATLLAGSPAAYARVAPPDPNVVPIVVPNPAPVQAVSVGGHGHFALYAVLAAVALLTLIVVYLWSARSRHLHGATS